MHGQRAPSNTSCVAASMTPPVARAARSASAQGTPMTSSASAHAVSLRLQAPAHQRQPPQPGSSFTLVDAIQQQVPS